MKIKEKDLNLVKFAQNHATIENGQGLLLEGEGEVFTLVCCDCGLAHTVEVGPTAEDHLVVIFHREDQKTAAYRRGNRPGLKEGIGKWKLTRII